MPTPSGKAILKEQTTLVRALELGAHLRLVLSSGCLRVQPSTLKPQAEAEVVTVPDSPTQVIIGRSLARTLIIKIHPQFAPMTIPI